MMPCWSFVAFGSSVLDPTGRIWCIPVWAFVAARLWWQELLQVTVLQPGISGNKAASSSAGFACGRSARRLWLGVSDELPWRKTFLEDPVASSLNKCRWLRSRGARTPFHLSAGHGGEGEEDGGLVVAEAGRWWGGLACPGVDSAPAATPRRCLCLATAIFGQKVGLAMLERCGRSSFFFLRFGRIFSYLRAATSVPADPSGHVPGVGRDGCGWRWSSGGALHGLDRVFESACRVLSAKNLGHVVIFPFLEVLFVLLYPLPS